MATDEGTTGYADDGPPGLAGLGGDSLNDDDRRLIFAWRDNLALQDPRYGDKGLMRLAAISMANQELRSRLLSDLDGVLKEIPALAADLPKDVTLRFFENTSDTLYVVLPPRAGETSRRPAPLREILSSRTAKVGPTSFQDDFDVVKDDFNFSDQNLNDFGGLGDPDFNDHP